MKLKDRINQKETKPRFASVGNQATSKASPAWGQWDNQATSIASPTWCSWDHQTTQPQQDMSLLAAQTFPLSPLSHVLLCMRHGLVKKPAFPAPSLYPFLHPEAASVAPLSLRLINLPRESVALCYFCWHSRLSSSVVWRLSFFVLVQVHPSAWGEPTGRDPIPTSPACYTTLLSSHWITRSLYSTPADC